MKHNPKLRDFVTAVNLWSTAVTLNHMDRAHTHAAAIRRAAAGLAASPRVRPLIESHMLHCNGEEPDPLLAAVCAFIHGVTDACEVTPCGPAPAAPSHNGAAHAPAHAPLAEPRD